MEKEWWRMPFSSLVNSLCTYFTMNYTLDSYGNFDAEQQMLETEANKKEALEKVQEAAEKEVDFRLKCISGYFLRLSWHHKKQFILAMVQNISCFDTLLRIISYIASLYGKLAAYSDATAHCKTALDQILVDHDRSLESDFLKETICTDLSWLSTLPNPRQILLVLSLLQMGGSGLIRKMYIPIVNIYNRKVMQQEQVTAEKSQRGTGLVALSEDIFDQPDPDDSDKYPAGHPMTIEVVKMRKKWDDAIAKLRQDVYGLKNELSKKPKPKKATKAGKKRKDSKADDKGVDWIQMLPIWIVKKILDHFDQKTLHTLKKVNHYWAFVCDSLIKDRQARALIDQAIQKLRASMESEPIEEGEVSSLPKPSSPRGKRLDSLMTRGAVLDKMRPRVRKSHQVYTSLVTSLPQDSGMCDPIDKMTVFPRLIKEDLLLYKRYPCLLKDVNIVVNVEEDLEEQRRTLSYSLSQQLSDTFSMSEANLADW